jgi:hypothetical protein
MKLTAAQEEVLGELKRGSVAHYMRYMGRFNPEAYWYLSGSQKRCTRQVKKLITLGLLTVEMDSLGYMTRARYLPAAPGGEG